LENGNWKLETGTPKLEGCGCMVLKSEISNLKFPLGVSTTPRARVGRFSPRGLNHPKWHGLGGV
jgi:hypothetical protein